MDGGPILFGLPLYNNCPLNPKLLGSRHLFQNMEGDQEFKDLNDHLIPDQWPYQPLSDWFNQGTLSVVLLYNLDGTPRYVLLHTLNL